MAPPDYLKSVQSPESDENEPVQETSGESPAAEATSESAAVLDTHTDTAAETAQPAEPLEPAPAGDPAPAEPEPDEQSSRYTLLGFIILAVVLGLFLIRAYGQIGVLEKTVATLESDLTRSRATVAAHEAHLGAIRSEVSDIAQRIGALDQLVNQPVSPTPQAVTPPPASGGSGSAE